MKKTIYVILLCFFFLSCGSLNKKDINDTETDLRQKEVDSLISKYSLDYDVKNMIDTLDYNFTIELQNLIGQDIQIIRDFKLIDIYNIGDSSHALIQIDRFSRDYFIDLNISKEDIKELIDNDGGFLGEFNKGFLLIKLSNIKKAQFSLETLNYDEDASSIVLSDLNVFKGDGDLIKIVLYPKVNNNSSK